MKNSKSKVLMTSVIMLVVAVMALTTATYAWFISSTEASVSTITMTAESAEGIRFSVDGTNWKNTLTLEDLEIDLTDKLFKPTSTNFEDNDNDKVWDFYYVDSYDNGQVTIAEDKAGTDTTPNYIAFSFYIQLDGTEAAVADGLYLTSAGIECAGELDSALRVAFIYNGIPTPINGEATVDTTGTKIVWQPGQEAATEEEAQADSYSPLKAATGIDEAGEKVTVAIDNFLIPNGNYTGTAIGTDHVLDSYFTESPAFEFDQVTPGATQAQYKVTIVIWIEGQDPDCTNAVASQSITADFVFGFTKP